MDQASKEELKHKEKGKKAERSCTICSNHGIRSMLKGHKRHCPFLNCHCVLCVKGRKKRGVMKKQVRLRRKQMKAIENHRTPCLSTAVEPIQVSFSPTLVKTESPFHEDQKTVDENDKTAKKENGGLIQSVSKILNSQFEVTRQQYPFNNSVYLPTPYQLPWSVADVYLGGFYQNSWLRTEPGTASCYVMEPLPCPNFTVSDNSAFVKYNVSPRIESNSFKFSLNSSAEAAAVLASFAGNQKHGKPKCERKYTFDPCLS